MIDEKAYREALDEMLRDPELLKMKQYYQHGGNTYAHSVHVAEAALKLARILPFHVKEKDLARGAMLHDFYLYGTNDMTFTAYQHGTRHPRISYENASRHFDLTDTEKDIILSHMWPLTFTRPPRCRESVVVTLADKYCATREYRQHFTRLIKNKFFHRQ
jgi:uncharacterized protein